MSSIEGPKDTVRRIKFTGDKKEKLRGYLQKELERTMSERSKMIENCKAWAKQANSRRKRKDAKARDSQLDMPLTRQRMMQNSARLMNPIFQQDRLYVAKPRNPAIEEIALEVEKVIDYQSDQIDYRSLCDEWIEQFQTFPLGVVKTPFVIETERNIKWQELQGGLEEYNERKLNGEPVVLRKLQDGNERYFIEVDEEVPIRVGTFPEVVPFEDFICPLSTVDVRTADVIWHRVWMTKPIVKGRIKSKVYDAKDGEQDVLDALGDPRDSREKLLVLSADGKESEDTSKQFEILETYLKWDIDGKGEVEIIVTFERYSMVILRAVHNFYHSYKRPFIVHQYKRVQGSIFGIPLTYTLEPLHVANTAIVNQWLDAGSKANETIWCFPPNSDLKQVFDRDSVRTMCVETTATKDEVFELKLSNPYPGLPEISMKLEREADRLSSLSEKSFGDEETDRPTVGGTVKLIEESKQPQYMMLEAFRVSLAQVAKHVLARSRQFYPEGLRYYVMQEDPEDVKMLEMFFEWPAGSIEKDILIETKVSSASMSKDSRKQEKLAMVEKLPTIYQTMMGMAQVAINPMDPSASVAFKLLQGFKEAVDSMFTEFEIGKKDILNPDLVQEVQTGQVIQQLQTQINQLSTQNQQLQASNAQLQAVVGQGQPVAGPPGGPPGVQGPMPMGPGAQGPQPQGANVQQ